MDIGRGFYFIYMLYANPRAEEKEWKRKVLYLYLRVVWFVQQYRMWKRIKLWTLGEDI